MRAVVQRVNQANVSIENRVTGEIGQGLVVFLGVGQGDTAADVDYLADKITHLRIFEDEAGKMNLSCMDINGELLVVSQFTLYGDCRKGRRPSFSSAAEPHQAVSLYESFVRKLREMGLVVETGVFQEEMLVEIHNDGPVTMLLDSRKEF